MNLAGVEKYSANYFFRKGCLVETKPIINFPSFDKNTPED
jgi:hypothetical protein